MQLSYFRDYCISKPGATEDTPFDEETLCFRVGGKIFAITSIAEFVSVNLKCDPERAVELRELHPEILPGFHMNKKHWNTILTNGNLPDSLLLELVDHSYELVYVSLPKKAREGMNRI